MLLWLLRLALRLLRGLSMLLRLLSLRCVLLRLFLPFLLPVRGHYRGEKQNCRRTSYFRECHGVSELLTCYAYARRRPGMRRIRRCRIPGPGSGALCAALTKYRHPTARGRSACENTRNAVSSLRAPDLRGLLSRSDHCTAMVTLLDEMPEIPMTRLTALPGETAAGTRAFT